MSLKKGQVCSASMKITLKGKQADAPTGCVIAASST